jgi:hypothetical protein
MKNYPPLRSASLFALYKHILKFSSGETFQAARPERRPRLVRSGILMAVTMKITAFWDMTPCSVVDMYKHFGGTFGLLFQSRRERGEEI